MMRRLSLGGVLLIFIALLSASCNRGPATPPSPSASPGAVYSRYQLEYFLFSRYPDFFWCDPDYYPVAREGQEELNAEEQFPIIKANPEEFAAILEHLNLPDKSSYLPSEKLSIYREHKKLTRAVQMDPSGNGFQFTLAVGEGQGYRIEGTITSTGKITETKRVSSFNTCPVCLARGVNVATPAGATPVENLLPGMEVWTLDTTGGQVHAPIIKTSSILVPPFFRLLRIRLQDGRALTVSPGHPAANGRPLGSYQTGELLDGSPVVMIESVIYDGTATYDLLPSGGTGLYWANGILLESTLNIR